MPHPFFGAKNACYIEKRWPNKQLFLARRACSFLALWGKLVYPYRSRSFIKIHLPPGADLLPVIPRVVAPTGARALCRVFPRSVSTWPTSPLVARPSSAMPSSPIHAERHFIRGCASCASFKTLSEPWAYCDRNSPEPTRAELWALSNIAPQPMGRSGHTPIQRDRKGKQAWHTPEKLPSPSSVLEPVWKSGSISQTPTVAAACRLLQHAASPCTATRVEDVFAPIYHSVSQPSLSSWHYMTDHLLLYGLVHKAHLADVVVLHTFALIERLIERNASRGLHLCGHNIHRVILSCMVISCKMIDDETWNNQHWASISGVSLHHLNALELFTVSALDFRCSVSALEVSRVRESLSSITCREAEY